MSTTIYQCTTGEWVTNLMGSVHHVQFVAQEYSTFMSLGLSEQGAVLIELTPHGVIESVKSVKTRDIIAQLDIPSNHGLYNQLIIGKPYAPTKVSNS